MRALPEPTCPFALLFGLPCPGCGLTRAALVLLHGDLERAISQHPLVLVVLGVMAWLGADLLLGQRWPHPAMGRRARWRLPLLAGLTAALVVLWLLRFYGMFGGPVVIASATKESITAVPH